jgi:cytochrome c peroxidase
MPKTTAVPSAKRNAMMPVINLGKTLFYDPILSVNNTISCASCHSPYSAFSHNDHDLSHGVYDSIGFRNAPALFNLASHTSFMWDGAIHHLEVQPLAPIHSKTEMGSSIQEVILKLKKDSGYRSLFKLVYGDTSITGERILKSLAAFQLSLISMNSKYDSVKRHQSSFTNQENNGYRLFLKHCNTCHTEPLFTNLKFANNGLKIDTTLFDCGRMRITKNPKDSLMFKVPSLRNLTYTYPYMHDGRFKKLYSVINHYSSDIKNQSFIDSRLKNGIALSENDKIDIIAFLLTLNDKTFINNSKHRMLKY